MVLFRAKLCLQKHLFRQSYFPKKTCTHNNKQLCIKIYTVTELNCLITILMEVATLICTALSFVIKDPRCTGNARIVNEWRMDLQIFRPLYQNPNIYLRLGFEFGYAKNQDFGHRVSVVRGQGKTSLKKWHRNCSGEIS